MTWDHQCRHCDSYLEYDWIMFRGHKRFVAWCDNPECYGEVEEAEKAEAEAAAAAAMADAEAVAEATD